MSPCTLYPKFIVFVIQGGKKSPNVSPMKMSVINMKGDTDGTILEDSDVARERERVNQQHPGDANADPLILKNLCKVIGFEDS